MKNSKSKIKMDIPESPFDLEVEDEIITDDEYEGFDDPDERLTDEEIDMLINYQFDSLGWKKEQRFDDLMKELDKLPSEIKQDDLVMDLRKKQIEDNGKQLGTQIGTDLISLFNKIDNEKN